eukprot:6183215-Pleurochrysis_carterae.AAC.2
MGEIRKRGYGEGNLQPSKHEGDEAVPAPRNVKGKWQRSTCKRCAFCCAGFFLLLLLLIFALLMGDALLHGRSMRLFLNPVGAVNFFFMRFARDVSRAKARRRRFGQENALMPILLGREDPLPLGDPDAGIALTPEELTEYDGRELPGTNGHAPLFLAIKGRIYDVTAGKPFYGPGRSYHKLVGKDATRAFCTGCLEPACLISNLEGLSDAQRKEADRWIELYEHHDKYKLVGRLRVPVAEEGQAEAEAEEEEEELVAMAQEAEGRKKYKPFRMR